VFRCGGKHFECTVGSVKEAQDGKEATPFVVRLDTNDEHVGVKKFVGPMGNPTLLRAWDLKNKNDFQQIKVDIWQVVTFLRTPTADKKVYEITM
jgi:hypothetical protein